MKRRTFLHDRLLTEGFVEANGVRKEQAVLILA